MQVYLFAPLVGACLSLCASAQSEAWNLDRPDAHAPALVMGDHTHCSDDWMFSLRAMSMRMDGLMRGSASLSNAELFGDGYMIAPESMKMDMLMLGGMYAPSDDLTLMVMVPYVEKSMDLVTMGGTHFTTEAKGLGDISVTGMVPVWSTGRQKLHVDLGIYLPTGSTSKRDATPMSSSAKLPYPMQLGTGTFDVQPGLTWLRQDAALSYGAQLTHRVSLDLNDEGYRYGARSMASVWSALEFAEGLSTSARLSWQHAERFHGMDAELNPSAVPTADARFTGGEQLDIGFGINWRTAAGQRFGVELGLPIEQDKHGIQMENEWTLGFVWQVNF